MKSILHYVYRLCLLTISLLGLISCSSLSSVDHQPFQQPILDILITNANVLSEDGQRMLPNRNILISNRRIASISSTPIDSSKATLIDGQGKYIIPGLIDSHVHLQDSENDLLVYLAHGVTYVREMSGNANHLKWSHEIRNGRVGPSLEVSSEKISSKSGIWGFINGLFWNRINISDHEEATELAIELNDKGYANAKVSSDINKPMYLAITQAAKMQNLSVTGHIPQSISFDEFIESNHKEVAHIEELVKILNIEFGYFNTSNGNEFLQFVDKRAREIAKVLKDNQVAVGTTLWYMQSIPDQVTDLSSLIKQMDFSFTNPKRVTEWMPENNEFANNHAHLKNWWLIFSEANNVILKALIDNNVTILAGTDAMTTLIVPGASMHQELQALVESGMSPSQAIQSATAVPADWMKVNVGKVMEGYEADLLILNENPLLDIKATRNINSVISKGRLYKHEILESMLDEIRKVYND